MNQMNESVRVPDIKKKKCPKAAKAETVEIVWTVRGSLESRKAAEPAHFNGCKIIFSN